MCINFQICLFNNDGDIAFEESPFATGHKPLDSHMYVIFSISILD